MAKVKNYFQKIKTFFLRRKKIIIIAAIALVVVYFFFFRSKKPDTVNVDTVKYADLTRSVRATGQVISNTDLDLSFNKASIVKSIKVAVGDKVSSGDVLATLDQGQAAAAVTEARGRLLSAQAKYNKTLEGASNEDVALAQVELSNAVKDLENTKNNQTILVANAYKTLLNSTVEAFSNETSSTQVAPVLSGTYNLGTEGNIKISSSQRKFFKTTGLVIFEGNVSATTPQPIGESGLFILFPESFSGLSDWIISIPNKKAPDYLENLNAYTSVKENQTKAVSTAQSLVDQKQAELNLKKAAARGTDIDIARAEVLSAQGSLQSAQSTYEDTIIRAPSAGTITKVDIKYGELSEAGIPVITLEDVDNLYIEALINEANIAYLKVGQTVGITFDAFGSDKKFAGTIAHIDPSAETSDGVVNYKIKVSLSEKDETIRPGMNANIDVLAGEVKNALTIPNIAVVRRDGKSYVNVFTDEKNNKYAEREVVTGFIGDNNMVEIVSGLREGEEIVLTLN